MPEKKLVEHLENPYPVYEKWRGDEPVHWEQAEEEWVVVRRSDIKEVLDGSEKAERFTTNRVEYLLDQIVDDNDDEAAPEDESEQKASKAKREKIKGLQEIFSNMLLMMDGDKHRDLRGIFKKSMDSIINEGNAELYKRLQAAASMILNEAIQQANKEKVALGVNNKELEIDIVNDYARRFTGLVIPQLMGVDPADKFPLLKRFQGFSQAIRGNFDVVPENVPFAAECADKLKEYFEERYDYYKKLDDKKATAEESGHLMFILAKGLSNGTTANPKAEFVSMLIFILIASLENIGALIANGVLTLLRDQKAMNGLYKNRMSPDYWNYAVNELIRYDSPVQSVPRLLKKNKVKKENNISSEDIGGKTVRFGEPVSLILSSANRDAALFEDTRNNLDLKRDAEYLNMAFGYGTHKCLGEYLVRTMAEVAIRTLLSHTERKTMKLAPVELNYRSDLPGYRVLRQLHVTFQKVNDKQANQEIMGYLKSKYASEIPS